MSESMFATRLASFCSALTRPLLIVTVLCVFTAWGGSVPAGWWPFGGPESNHGPWRHYTLGRLLLIISFILPLMAFGVASVGFYAGGRSVRLAQGFLGVPLSIAIVTTHFWLID
jgi:hypothetical protein